MKSVAVLLISFFLMHTAVIASDTNDGQSGHWTVELSGGLQFFSPNELGLATESENKYLDIYFRNNPSLRTLSNPAFSEFTHQIYGRTRIKYSVGPHFRIAAGLGIFQGNLTNSGLFSFQRDQGWRILTDSLDYQAMNTKLNMIYPHLGLFYHLPLSASMEIELGVSAGPVFAKASLTRHITDSIDAREVNPVQEYLMYRDERSLSMEGSGSGFGASAELKIGIRLNRFWDLFFETGYNRNHLNSLSGSSTMQAGGQSRTWEGSWFLVSEQVDKSWGSASFSYPSNDPQLEGFRSGDFQLNIHGFLTLQMGVIWHL